MTATGRHGEAREREKALLFCFLLLVLFLFVGWLIAAVQRRLPANQYDCVVLW